MERRVDTKKVTK